ncbi:MAG: hypothetical protein ACON5F_15215 [Jejuia sp.]
MNQDVYLELTEQIISSKSFGRSDTYANMLRYLVKCSIEDNIPKETTIANDIFGKENFDPAESTLIRVYAYNLRKKLQKYYENEGVNDKIILQIPKGNYEVLFVNKSKEKSTLFPPSRIWGIAIILTFLLVPFLFDFNKLNEAASLALWEDILEGERTSMLVLGDLFIYSEEDSIKERQVTIRDPFINSKAEFESLKLNDDNKTSSLEPLSYAFLIRNSATWVKDLSKVFYQADTDFIIRTMSRFNPKELSDNDLVVVGMLKTLGVFKDYFSKEGYQINGDILTHINEKSGEISIYSPKGDADQYHTDYAIILKVNGPNNNSIYLFAGIWDTGASQSLKTFTDYKLALDIQNQLKETFGEIPDSYKILLEVSGIDRMELNSKIIHLEKIDN